MAVVVNQARMLSDSSVRGRKPVSPMASPYTRSSPLAYSGQTDSLQLQNAKA